MTSIQKSGYLPAKCELLAGVELIKVACNKIKHYLELEERKILEIKRCNILDNHSTNLSWPIKAYYAALDGKTLSPGEHGPYTTKRDWFVRLGEITKESGRVTSHGYALKLFNQLISENIFERHPDYKKGQRNICFRLVATDAMMEKIQNSEYKYHILNG